MDKYIGLRTHTKKRGYPSTYLDRRESNGRFLYFFSLLLARIEIVIFRCFKGVGGCRAATVWLCVCVPLWLWGVYRLLHAVWNVGCKVHTIVPVLLFAPRTLPCFLFFLWFSWCFPCFHVCFLGCWRFEPSITYHRRDMRITATHVLYSTKTGWTEHRSSTQGHPIGIECR